MTLEEAIKAVRELLAQLNIIRQIPLQAVLDTDPNFAQIEKAEVDECAQIETDLKAIVSCTLQGEADQCTAFKTRLDTILQSDILPFIAAHRETYDMLQRIIDYRKVHFPQIQVCPFANETRPETLYRACVESNVAVLRSMKVLRKGPIWESVEGNYLMLASLSNRNITKLKKVLKVITKQENIFIDTLCSIDFQMIHHTKYFSKFVDTKVIYSYAEVQRKEIDVGNNTTSPNIKHLANHDNVFFRFSAPGSVTASRFGPKALVFSARNATPLYQFGWVSLHDMIDPIPQDSEVMNCLRFDGARIGAGPVKRRACCVSSIPILPGIRDAFAILAPTPELNDKIFCRYYDTRREVTKSVLDEVFFGSDILLGIALSAVRELRLIGGDFYASMLKNAGDGNAVGALLHNLFRVEAKVPSFFQYADGSLVLKETGNPIKQDDAPEDSVDEELEAEIKKLQKKPVSKRSDREKVLVKLYRGIAFTLDDWPVFWDMLDEQDSPSETGDTSLDSKHNSE